MIEIATILINNKGVYYSYLATALEEVCSNLGEINPRNLEKLLRALSTACEEAGCR